ncbi:ATP-binding cassette domain-containing protein [Alphaproteobacteria bacterium HT1-32]|nr:ATP-binding cassette domain-containing protein [Alphaproteobacteria bacterium HT1-32]
MALLRIEDLRKSFGGVTATDNVNLDVTENEIHAIIGPNGAGKTTLISQLSGEQYPDSGRIIFDGRTITRSTAYRRSHLGLARSFQITSVFQSMTVLQNVALAVQAHSGHSFRFWKAAGQDPELTGPAEQALARVGLTDRRQDLVSNLSHGEKRQLEIAMALATSPKMLLLDEPMAGMGPEESQRMVQVLQSLKGEKTMLLIEHDMDVVFALADRISVLVYGQIIASGSPEEVRNDDAVKRAYLGDEAA